MKPSSVGRSAVDPERYRVRSVVAAVQILNALAEEAGQTMSEVAQRTGLSASLVYRMLVTLESEGMVARDRFRRYALGSRTMHLGYQAQRAMPLAEAARPTLRDLAESTRETVHLAVRDRYERVIVATVDSPHAVRVATPVGSKYPLHYGGTGLCILAHLTESEREHVLAGPLVRKTSGTEIDADRIRVTLRAIRARGYHVAVGDFAEGAFSIAAPVFATDGAVVGAVCAVGPELRLDDALAAAVPDQVRAAAARISLAMGFGADGSNDARD